jgi:hypothetical protein
MSKHQSRRMEELPLKTYSFPAICAFVLRIAAHGMPDRGHVSADLVGPAGFEANPQQRRSRESFQDLEMGYGRACAVRPG